MKYALIVLLSASLPATVPARDELTTAQFNQMMTVGLKQAREDDSFDVDEVFDELEGGINV